MSIPEHRKDELKLKQFTDCVGPIYGTEDFGIYFYSVIKMMKPKSILELGTGLGTTMLWAAQALDENNRGKIHTIDDGSEWDHLKKARDQMGKYFREDYLFYIENLIDSFNVRKFVEFHPVQIEEIQSDNQNNICNCGKTGCLESIVSARVWTEKCNELNIIDKSTELSKAYDELGIGSIIFDKSIKFFSESIGFIKKS